jgi:dipeptidyl aminopeptidase/acylaminoacyl peptidase
MRRHLAVLVLATIVVPAPARAQRAAATGGGGYSLEQVRAYPYPAELTASASGSRLAWTLNERGQRNVYVAEGPDFTPRRVTRYLTDDGQELTSLAISSDGQYVVYLRGGDHGSNWDDDVPVNVTSAPMPPKVQILSVPFAGGEAGGEPKVLGDGEEPVLSPRGDAVAFVKNGQIWTAPIDGAAPGKALFTARGTNSAPRWSPDGTRLAFVSGRGDHAFIGVYTSDTMPILWLEATFARDRSPCWSPDGRSIAFVRGPGGGGEPDSLLVRRHAPWEIWTADAATGRGRRLWKAPETLRGSVPSTHGGTNLQWAAGGGGGGGRIVFLSYQDGWPHLYSIPATGGEALLLTPGDYMAEHIRLSPDGRWLVFAGNAGPAPQDLHRRHVVRVPVDRAQPEVVTAGAGIEWSPVVTGDGATLAFIGATVQNPPVPTVMPFRGGARRPLGADRIPADFPAAQFVTPTAVTFKASDGGPVYAQLFERRGGPAKKPAVIYVHGGPPRQMLLGWHYSDYYANAYALNQYLASRGFVVLSVNYRLGIGYGYEFHQPANGGARGAAEYLDVKAAAEYLRALPQVDPARVGIYGGSYGGFLTAMALARNSDLFAAGVDIHGVHDWTTERARGMLSRDRFEEAPDLQRALETAWQSSPVSAMATWRSPVLVIHADDDRNVRFSQSTDLVQRLVERKIPHETLVIPEDTHHFLRYANMLAVDSATAEFLERTLKGARAVGAR